MHSGRLYDQAEDEKDALYEKRKRPLWLIFSASYHLSLYPKLRLSSGLPLSDDRWTCSLRPRGAVIYGPGLDARRDFGSVEAGGTQSYIRRHSRFMGSALM